MQVYNTNEKRKKKLNEKKNNNFDINAINDNNKLREKIYIFKNLIIFT